MHSDAQRRRLYEGLGDAFDNDTRDLLMELLPPVGWADVARTADITALRGEISELRGEIALAAVRTEGRLNQLEARLDRHDARFDSIDARFESMDARFESIDARFESMDARFDRQLVKLASINLASMVGISGLVLAAVQLG